jgi:hypothetical protein
MWFSLAGGPLRGGRSGEDLTRCASGSRRRHHARTASTSSSRMAKPTEKRNRTRRSGARKEHVVPTISSLRAREPHNTVPARRLCGDGCAHSLQGLTTPPASPYSPIGRLAMRIASGVRLTKEKVSTQDLDFVVVWGEAQPRTPTAPVHRHVSWTANTLSRTMSFEPVRIRAIMRSRSTFSRNLGAGAKLILPTPTESVTQSDLGANLSRS